MSWIQISLALALILLSGVAVLLQFASLPGTWIILLLAVATRLVEAILPLGPEPLFGLWALVLIAGLALLAELFELGASAAGAKTGGASRRGMLGAVIGSMLGAIIISFIILIPVVGTLLGALIGAAIGAIVGELSVGGKTLRETARPAAGAVAGRLLGVLVKTGFACAMLGVLAVSAFL
jgi:uncharacterized protein YqgC (DUF456 family)